jgi:ABC-type transport system involved in multi-copper enzyme maturation permease subunit
MMFLIFVVPRLAGGENTVAVPEFLIIAMVGIVCFLTLLLWSSTIVDAELEGKTWVYTASRPRGRISSLLGKLLAAMVQSMAVTAVALTGSVLVARLAGALYNPLQLLGTLLAMFAIAIVVYGCVLSFLGAYFFKRAMVACVAWALVSELFLAGIPAVVRFFSVRYHLQELVFRWYDWLFPGDIQGYRELYGDYGIWFHLVVLALIAAAGLLAAIWRITHHEFLSADDS